MLNGCMSAADMIDSLSKSDRSWCLSLTTIYGTVRVGGTGADQAVVLCNQEGLKVDMPHALGAVPVATGGTIVIPAPPRVLMQEAPTYQEIDPSTLPRSPLPAVRQAPPTVRPQSAPDSRIRDLLKQIKLMQ
mgnify:CR=1 FL=1